jgi:hypothetical protein
MLRQQKHFIKIAKKYPRAWRLVDELRASRGKNGIPDWRHFF